MELIGHFTIKRNLIALSVRNVVTIVMTLRLDSYRRSREPADASVPFRQDLDAPFFSDAPVGLESTGRIRRPLSSSQESSDLIAARPNAASTSHIGRRRRPSHTTGGTTLLSRQRLANPKHDDRIPGSSSISVRPASVVVTRSSG